MNSKFIECLMNPIMCKLFMDINTDGEMTAKQLAKRHPDITQATLYRYIKRMTADGVIKVSKEQQIRGTVERTYALAIDFNATIEDIVNSNSGESYMVLFMQYLFGLTTLFSDYCKRDSIDIKKDISAFNSLPIYVTDEEILQALNQIGAILASLMEQEPSQDRKLRTIGLILTPPHSNS